MSVINKLTLLFFGISMVSCFFIKDNKAFEYIAEVSFAAFIVMIFVISRKQKSNAKKTKSIKSDFIASDYPRLSYDTESCLPIEEFFSLGIISPKDRNYNYTSEGLISGLANGVPFRAERAELYYLVKRTGNGSRRVSAFKGIIAVYDLRFCCPYKIKVYASHVVAGNEESSLSNIVRKIADVGNSFTDDDMSGVDLTSAFGKPVMVYSTDVGYAAEFFDEKRISSLKNIPFERIIIDSNRLVLCLNSENATIVRDAERNAGPKIRYVDYNADVDAEKVKADTKINLDMILSFPNDIGLR